MPEQFRFNNLGRRRAVLFRIVPAQWGIPFAGSDVEVIAQPGDLENFSHSWTWRENDQFSPHRLHSLVLGHDHRDPRGVNEIEFGQVEGNMFDSLTSEFGKHLEELSSRRRIQFAVEHHQGVMLDLADFSVQRLLARNQERQRLPLLVDLLRRPRLPSQRAVFKG
jgi:hypothetical protein